MTTNEILQKLQNARKTSNGYQALCPSHADKKRSLSIKESNGKILLNCFAGCDTQAIVSALGIELKDLFSEMKPNNSASNFQSKKIVAVYQYADESGNLISENVRFDPKDFRQRHFDENGKEVWSLNGTRRVPYRLPELIKAVKDGADVWLCEGEKDADNLRTLGLTASSFKNWKSDFNQYLKTAHVCLIKDHDKAGLKQADEVCKLLSGNVASLKTLDFYADEPLPEKHGKDLSDWFESQKQDGLSPEEIAEKLCIWTDNANAWTVNETSEEVEPKTGNQKKSFVSILRRLMICILSRKKKRLLSGKRLYLSADSRFVLQSRKSAKARLPETWRLLYPKAIRF